MALSRLDSLYMAVVADHSKSPHHHGVLPNVEQLQLNNPTCGDVINLSVKFDGDMIEDIAFAGDGCTISTASSSMMPFPKSIYENIAYGPRIQGIKDKTKLDAIVEKSLRQAACWG